MPNEHPAPPVAERIDHPITAHSHVRNDPWAWLRLSEEQREADPPDAHTKRVIAHLEAENTYAEHWLAPVKELRERLFLEMKARVKEEDLSVPYRENGFWYNQRYDKGKEYAVQLRAPVRPDGSVPEAYDVLLDENVLAEGCEFFDLGDFDALSADFDCR